EPAFFLASSGSWIPPTKKRLVDPSAQDALRRRAQFVADGLQHVLYRRQDVLLAVAKRTFRNLGCGGGRGWLGDAMIPAHDDPGEAGGLDWSRISVDSFSLRAVRGGPVWRKPGRPGQAWIQAAPGG